MANLKHITFESGSLTGADAFDAISTTALATIEIEATTPIVGVNSAHFVNPDSGDVATGEVAYASPYKDANYIAFYLKLNTWPEADTTIFQMADSGLSAIGGVRLTSTGRLVLLEFGTTVRGSSSDPLVLGTVYRVEFTRVKSVASDGLLQLGLATKDGVATTVASHVSTNTATIRRVRWQAPNARISDFVVDEAMIDDAAMPTLAAPNPEPPVDFAAATILELEAFHHFPSDFAAVTILELQAEGEEIRQTANNFRALTILELAPIGQIAQENNFRAVTILELLSQENYVGPGTGFRTGEPLPANIREAINSLREGDRQRVLFTWAGVDALNTLIRVKQRSIENTDDRQDIEPDVTLLDDPSLVQRQRGGKNPSVTVSRSGNVFRKVNEQRRKIRQDT